MTEFVLRGRNILKLLHKNFNRYVSYNLIPVTLPGLCLLGKQSYMTGDFSSYTYLTAELATGKEIRGHIYTKRLRRYCTILKKLRKGPPQEKTNNQLSKVL